MQNEAGLKEKYDELKKEYDYLWDLYCKLVKAFNYGQKN